MKPVSEWTDDELRACSNDNNGWDLAAEVLRLRAETDEWSDRMDAMYAKLTARAEQAEALLLQKEHALRAELAAARAEAEEQRFRAKFEVGQANGLRAHLAKVEDDLAAARAEIAEADHATRYWQEAAQSAKNEIALMRTLICEECAYVVDGP